MKLTITIPDDLITWGQLKDLHTSKLAHVVFECADGSGILMTCDRLPQPVSMTDVLELKASIIADRNQQRRMGGPS